MGEEESEFHYCQVEVEVQVPDSTAPDNPGGRMRSVPCYCWTKVMVHAPLNSFLLPLWGDREEYLTAAPRGLHWHPGREELVTPRKWWKSYLPTQHSLTPPWHGGRGVPRWCWLVMEIQAPHVVSTDSMGRRGSLQPVRGRSLGSPLNFWPLLMGVRVDPQCFSWCLIGVDGLLPKNGFYLAKLPSSWSFG